jgi:hypothetical protein
MLFNIKSDFQNSFSKLNSFFLNDLDLNYSYTYGMDRQHTYASSLSILPMSSTLVDSKGLEKFFDYSFKKSFTPRTISSLPINRFDYSGSTPSQTPTSVETLSNTYNKLLPNNSF